MKKNILNTNGILIWLINFFIDIVYKKKEL